MPLQPCGPVQVSASPVSWEETEGSALARRRPDGWCLSHGSWEGRVQRGRATLCSHEKLWVHEQKHSPLLQKRFLKLHEYLVTWGRDLLHFAQDKEKIQPSATFPRE